LRPCATRKRCSSRNEVAKATNNQSTGRGFAGIENYHFPHEM
jgi:hypothetical protein